MPPKKTTALGPAL
jgi:RecA-family ATPase